MPAQTVDIPKRWPLVSKFQSRDTGTPITKDARLINCYAELDPEDNEYWIWKRPGIAATPIWTVTGGGLGLYTYTFPPSIARAPITLFAAGITLFSAVAGAAPVTTVGSLPTVGGFGNFLVSFEAINSSPQTIVLQNQLGGAIYTPSTGGYVPITDATFTAIALVPGWAYLDGWLFVMDTSGAIWGSASQNSAVTWSALNKILASTQADQGVFIATQLTYVIAFKQWTTQPFWDAGNPAPGSPLSPIPNAQIPYGCFSPWTVKKIDEILLWVTANRVPSAQVIMMENLNPKIVSTPAIDRILRAAIGTTGSVGGGSAFYSWTTKYANHRWYGVTINNLSITIVFDIDQKLWYIWNSTDNNLWPVADIGYIPPIDAPFGHSKGLYLAQDISTGSIYSFDETVFADKGVPFAVDIYTPNVTAGTQRIKQLNMMYFLADKVQGQLLARYSDDDYQTWSNFRVIDLFDDRPLLDQDGSFYRRAYHFRYLTNNKFRIKSSDLQLDIGTL